MLEPSRPGPRPFFRFKRRRVRTVAILPTLITLGNAVCGFLAITYIAKGWSGAGEAGIAQGHFEKAALLILVAMIFDALDGKVARMTRTASNFGTQLDSLCDFLTFGVAPAFLVYAMGTLATNPAFPERVVLVVSIFYLCCAATRLARFNVETGTDEKYHREFSGFPSPAAAGVVASTIIPWVAIREKWPLADSISDLLQAGLPVTIFFLAVLMVSRIPYPHIVNKLFRGPRPFVTFIELAVVVLLGAIFHEFALFLAFFGYAVTGPALWIRARILKKPAPAPGGLPDPPGDKSLF